MYLCSISSYPIRFESVKFAFENQRDLLRNHKLSLPRGRTAIWLKNVQFFFLGVLTHSLNYVQTLSLGFKEDWLISKYHPKDERSTRFWPYSTPRNWVLLLTCSHERTTQWRDTNSLPINASVHLVLTLHRLFTGHQSCLEKWGRGLRWQPE